MKAAYLLTKYNIESAESSPSVQRGIFKEVFGMIESMYFVIVNGEARAEIQIKVNKGFSFEVLGLRFSHSYDSNGNESIKLTHIDSGEYAVAYVKVDNAVDDEFNPNYVVHGNKIVFKALETTHFLWHHSCHKWGEK
jgi:hypothetical protein